MSKRLVILSGPACVGKGPAVAAIDQFHPKIKYSKIPVIKSKESRNNNPRPEDEPVWNDTEYWRTKDEIYALKSDPQYIVGDCRGFPQAVNLIKVVEADLDLIFIEIYHSIGRHLLTSRFLTETEIITVFISPTSHLEIAFLRACNVSPTNFLKGLMVRKQKARADFQDKIINRELLLDITIRAEDSVDELRSAPDYSYIVVNHDGEGSPNRNCNAKYKFSSQPKGDAGKTVERIVHILQGKEPKDVEHWPHGVI